MGNDASGTAALDAIWQSTRSVDYAAWSADKTAGTMTAFSDNWLKDRADLLERKNYFNTKNASYDSSKPDAYGQADATQYDGEDIVWKDRQSDLTVQRGGITANTKYVVFGTDQSEADITGDARADRLYGGGGNDTLSGLADNDILEGGTGDDTLIGGSGSDQMQGGSGTDTYTFSGTWGNDVIMDADGLGQIVVDQTVLSGGKKTSANTYLSADKKYSYQRNTDGSLVIHQKDSNSAITIRDWSQDKLGINLSETLFDPTAPNDRGVQILKGDQRPPTATNTAGLAYYDWSKTTWAADGTLVGGVAEADFADVLKAGNGGSVLYGYGGNDALGGGAGVDDIFGGDGNDLIGGGAGADNIRGGAGNDRIHSGGTVSAYDRYFVGETWGKSDGEPMGATRLPQGKQWCLLRRLTAFTRTHWATTSYGVFRSMPRKWMAILWMAGRVMT